MTIFHRDFRNCCTKLKRSRTKIISSSAGQREVFVFLRNTDSSRIIKFVRLARLKTMGKSKLEARDKLTLASYQSWSLLSTLSMRTKQKQKLFFDFTGNLPLYLGQFNNSLASELPRKKNLECLITQSLRSWFIRHEFNSW